MKEFNSKGWTCTQSREDPSLFIITNPDGKHSFVLIHTDDCDVYAEKAEDGAIIADKFDKRFTIKMVDPSLMLGIKRDRWHDDDTGVTHVRLTQPAFIEDLYATYKDHMPKWQPSTPFPSERVPIAVY